MLQVLYDAGLVAGSVRPEFEAAGFVPSSAGSASFDEGDAVLPGYTVRQEGIETVVIKPVCEGGL
jgi:hypothetical protein